MALTPEQRQRVETNRKAALQRKRAAQGKPNSSYCNTTTTSVLWSPSSPPLSQESTASTVSSSSNNSKMPRLNNPFLTRSSLYADRQSSLHLESGHVSSFNSDSRESPINEILPPLPKNAPKLRKETIQSLSEQQLAVIELARPPSTSYFPDHSKEDNCVHDEDTQDLCNDVQQQQQTQQGYMVRVTAAAGSGKTTTLLHLAIRCLDLGHTNVTYVTFSRASAADAKKRILDLMHLHNHVENEGKVDCITASTLHSCAMQLVNRDKVIDETTIERGITNDYALQGIIAKEFSRDIENYLDPAIRRIISFKNNDSDAVKEFKGKQRAMRELVVFYLYKSFMNFCHNKMTLEQLRDESYYKRNWFPLTKNFRKDERAGKLGFPPEIYSLPKSYKFYADTCVKLWEFVLENGIRMFDTEMKKAQLMNLRIPCSVLLVDECQDLDECQVDFIDKQKNFGTHVFFVGDAAQTIYSFRGARSYNVMSLPNCIDRFLTKSFRFGPAVAQIANVALYVKENSPQTTEYIGKDRKLWIPYRVEGVSQGDDESIVTTRSLLQRDGRNKRPVTIIGRKNGTLLKVALELMNLGHLEQQQDEFDVFVELTDERPNDELEDFLASPSVLLKSLPKFHINGKGETSGARMWHKAIKQIECLYELFMAKEDGGALPPNLFPEFADYDHLTWHEFIASYQDRELNQYVKSVDVIMTYGKNTMRAVNVFKAQLEAQHTEEEADFILTTCHAAKGLEWDFVQVCGDFLNLQEKSYVCNKPSQFRPPFLSDSTNVLNDAKPVRRSSWQFAISSYDDELNFIYVACTRAKKILSLPKSIEGLLRECDLLHYCVSEFKEASVKPLENEESMMVLSRDKKKLSKGEVWALYHDLCVPLRMELGVQDDCNIMKSLFAIDDENLEDDDVSTEGTDCIAVKTDGYEHSQHYDC